MPYKSKAQAAYFNKNRAKLEAQGVDVDEWNAASKGKRLPQRSGEPKLLGQPFRSWKGSSKRVPFGRWK